MAALQSIRNHGAALIITVGVAMLAFIMGDFLTSGRSLWERHHEEVVGTIAGHDVTRSEFETVRERINQRNKIEYPNAEISDAQVREEAWQLLEMDYLLRAEAEKLGLTVTDEEVERLTIVEPCEIITSRPLFVGEEGTFSPEALQQFYDVVVAEGANDPNLRPYLEYWKYWENVVRISYLQNKIMSMVRLSVKANDVEAQFAGQIKQASANVEYVLQPYYTVADSLVKVTNADVEALYNQRKGLYNFQPYRAINYITFDIVPSEEDINKINEIVTKAAEELKTTDNIASVVNATSDREYMYNGVDYNEENVPAEFKDFAFGKGAKKGDFRALEYNPETHVFTAARLVECGYSMPDSVEIKQIVPAELLDSTKGEPEAQWVPYVALYNANKDLYTQAMKAKRGEVISYVNGEDTIRFEVTDVARYTPKAKVAIISREVIASKRTRKDTYNRATRFIIDNPTADGMRMAALQAGLNMRPSRVGKMDNNINGLNGNREVREIVKWAYSAKVGAISNLFDCGDTYVIAIVNEINDGKYPSLESLSGELYMMALDNAKAKYIKDQLKGVQSLEQAAEVLGQSVQSAEGVSMTSTNFGKEGLEPAAVGTALALEAGQLSAPVQGVKGIYVLRGLGKNVAAGEVDVEAEKAVLNQRYQSQYLFNQAMQQMLNEADVIDNRADIY